MRNLLKNTLFTGVSLVMLTMPTHAGTTKSLTKTVAGMSYKLTMPNPLPMGDQKLILKINQGSKLVKAPKLTAIVTMADGMKSPVKITSKVNGEFELKTNFSMGGEWELKLQQTSPTKAAAKFDLMVTGDSHSNHHM